MKHLNLFNEWVTTSTSGQNIETDYVSNDKIYYGKHDIQVSRGQKLVDVKSKFDTGARSSSIDYKVAEELGLSKRLIDECRNLNRIKIPKTIGKKETKQLEKRYTKKMKSKFPEISFIKIAKSSSGFSMRAYIPVTIYYHGNVVKTDVNLRDRTGLSCEMLLGLKDML